MCGEVMKKLRLYHGELARSLTHFSLVQSLSHVWLFASTWTAAHQASLPITSSWRLLKLMSIESVMPSNHLILCHPFLLLSSIFPSIRVFFPMSKFLASGGQSNGASVIASVLPMNIQDWSLLGLTAWISLQSKGLSRIHSATVSIVSPSICHEVMGPAAMILVFWMLSFKPTFSLSSFTFIKRLFKPSSLFAINRSST